MDRLHDENETKSIDRYQRYRSIDPSLIVPICENTPTAILLHQSLVAFQVETLNKILKSKENCRQRTRKLFPPN